MTVDSRVNSHSEDVLVVLREYPRVDDVTIIARLAWVDVDTADDSGRSSLDVDAAALVEFVCKDISVEMY